MNSTPSHVAGLAYQVRAQGSGRVLAHYWDAEMAERTAELYGHDGYRTYVVFVELIDGVWTAQED